MFVILGVSAFRFAQSVSEIAQTRQLGGAWKSRLPLLQPWFSNQYVRHPHVCFSTKRLGRPAPAGRSGASAAAEPGRLLHCQWGLHSRGLGPEERSLGQTKNYTGQHQCLHEIGTKTYQRTIFQVFSLFKFISNKFDKYSRYLFFQTRNYALEWFQGASGVPQSPG